MGENIFNKFEAAAAGGSDRAPWAARAPYRPEADFDLMLIPRLPKGADWREDAEAMAALDRLEAEDWVASLDRDRKQPVLKLSDEWIEAQGEVAWLRERHATIFHEQARG